jgi:hypothetical protein
MCCVITQIMHVLCGMHVWAVVSGGRGSGSPEKKIT